MHCSGAQRGPSQHVFTKHTSPGPQSLLPLGHSLLKQLKLAAHSVGAKAVAIAQAKVNLTFSEAFFRGIGCNWLVCLAVWMALSAKEIAGKILAIFFPIMAFVALGYEHCVANMYFIPM